MSNLLNQSASIADRFKLTDTTAPIKASGGILTLTGQPLDTETVTVGTKTYTYQTVLIQSDGNVLISPVDASESLDNLIAAIKVDPAFIGSRYGSPTVINADAVGSAGAGDTMDVEARRPGDFGNLVALSETLTNGSWNQAFLTGGVSANTWLDMNKTTRLPGIASAGTVFVDDINKLPAPVANVIDLDPGNYVITGTVDFGLNSLRFDHPGQNLVIQTLDQTLSSVTSSTTGIFLDVVNALQVRLISLNIILSGAGVTLYSLQGITNNFISKSVTTTFIGGGVTSVGTVNPVNSTWENAAFLNFRNGMVIDDVVSFLFSGGFFVSDFIGTGPLIKINNVSLDANLSDAGGFGSGAQSLFDIDPALTISGQIFINRFVAGANPYFASGITGTITNIVDASIASTTINSVTDSAGNAGFNFTVGPTVEFGRRVTMTGHSEPTYNDTGIVLGAAAGFFTIRSDTTGLPILFVGPSTGGSFTSNAAQVTSSAPHGIPDQQTLLITETINFNAGYLSYQGLLGPSDFFINLPGAFPGVETTGIWDTGSLTEKDRRINVKNGAQQKDSIVAGGWDVAGNVAPTTVASGVFNDIDFTGLIRLSYNERVNVVDFVNGAVEYTGLNPSIESIPIEFYIIPNNAANREYDFKLLIDTGAGFVDLPDVIVTRANVQGANFLFSTRRTVLLGPGDKYKWVQSGVITTNGFTAQSGCSTI